jgi:hypothetical protein
MSALPLMRGSSLNTVEAPVATMMAADTARSPASRPLLFSLLGYIVNRIPRCALPAVDIFTPAGLR